ncbi:MAG: hypothetical protein MR639_12340 [Clostridium sp.]|uniref:fused DSP-PTPase phosphatase/NAD kinase-like protein n=1 Tax=Clostridium sp. TaxID=1506 RepID=UPI002A86C9EF|nr:hypothetical protein [Clostridium sp.]MDY5099394.1 hypothetical protein [Clostridium sp.]
MKRNFYNSRKKLYSILCLLLALFLFTPTIAKADTGNLAPRLMIDFNNNGEFPNSFRKMSDKIYPTNNIPSIKGLDKLNASGSAEFTSNSLDIIKSSIGKKFVVVDLRQESHGFLNGSAISWLGLKNDLNKGLSQPEVVKKEDALLGSIKLNTPIKPFNSPGNIVANSVSNEETLVKSKDLDYIRFAVTDGESPTDDVVEDFVKYAASLPSDTWLHFHCKEGQGRTTTFLSMYDMMKNSKDVSFDDIIFRQFLLGRENLLQHPLTTPTQRESLLTNFYKYTKENKDNFKTSWTDWLKSNNIPLYLGCN